MNSKLRPGLAVQGREGKFIGFIESELTGCGVIYTSSKPENMEGQNKGIAFEALLTKFLT